ncbi:GGDEF-domain containing protein [Devosia pacifica]|uniref:GGDEF-domain containing protein n=1 Tax=Devosia pacifica TaxID=1335967 RepID=A0A918S5Y6_9HYPH|nr:GGDEF domain-containing phosphodiesterase [Devosia pacifica]GHA25861.1 GGDEF-domain containing protein [Devosia pacifica]
MTNLTLYAAISRFGALNYRAKIMLMAFIGTHIPLLGIIAYSVFNLTRDPGLIWSTLGIALAATLVGTGITLFVLNQLLAPVILTSKALRTYRETRELPALPVSFRDEVGTLMADASHTLQRLDAAMVQLETVDPATGLMNRDAFTDTLNEMLAQDKAPAVCVVRVANYARLLATYDQSHADGFMRQLADRLEAGLERNVPLARVEAAAFAFIKRVDAGRPESVEAVLRENLSSLSHPVPVAGVEAMPELTGGVALAGVDGAYGADLLDAALAAAANTTIPKTVSRHAPRVRQEIREQFELEQDLRKALDSNEFLLHFQPVVCHAEGRARSAEALIRWDHPQRGLVQPSQFIPIAERSGLIDKIGLWVMREACAQVGRWNAHGGDRLKVAINLSASQFLDPRLRDMLAEAIEAEKIAPDQLEIELTESAAMVDHDYTRRTFGRLKDLGLSIAIDDFGTGYASMSYLRKLPFDKLKIDREFVSNVDTQPDAQAICSAMIALGNGLGLHLLAEGAERIEEVDYLASRGCNLFQGYYYSRPVPAGELIETLSDIELLSARRKAEMPAPAKLRQVV